MKQMKMPPSHGSSSPADSGTGATTGASTGAAMGAAVGTAAPAPPPLLLSLVLPVSCRTKVPSPVGNVTQKDGGKSDREQMACFRNKSYADTRVYTPGFRANAQPYRGERRESRSVRKIRQARPHGTTNGNQEKHDTYRSPSWLCRSIDLVRLAGVRPSHLKNNCIQGAFEYSCCANNVRASMHRTHRINVP
jgi:hypothetical protein